MGAAGVLHPISIGGFRDSFHLGTKGNVRPGAGHPNLGHRAEPCLVPSSIGCVCRQCPGGVASTGRSFGRPVFRDVHRDFGGFCRWLPLVACGWQPLVEHPVYHLRCVASGRIASLFSRLPPIAISAHDPQSTDTVGWLYDPARFRPFVAAGTGTSEMVQPVRGR